MPVIGKAKATSTALSIDHCSVGVIKSFIGNSSRAPVGTPEDKRHHANQGHIKSTMKPHISYLQQEFAMSKIG
jgi:hypothetical protein